MFGPAKHFITLILFVLVSTSSVTFADEPRDQSQVAEKKAQIAAKLEHCKSLKEADKGYWRCKKWMDMRQLREQCKNIEKGDELYDRCMKMKRANMTKRIAYCKSIEEGEQGYERCQNWLDDQGVNKRINRCKSLKEGDEHYERCQSWLRKIEKTEK